MFTRDVDARASPNAEAQMTKRKAEDDPPDHSLCISDHTSSTECGEFDTQAETRLITFYGAFASAALCND